MICRERKLRRKGNLGRSTVSLLDVELLQFFSVEDSVHCGA
jgi:hypothetical protein